MMRKFFFVLAVVFLLAPSLVSAQGISTSPVRQTQQEEIRQRIEEKRLEIEKKREEIRSRIQSRKATASARLTEARKARIRAYWQRLDQRIKAAITRLEVLISRIESRLEIIEETYEDIDTEKIHEDLDEAKDLLNSSSSDLEAAGALADGMLASEDPKFTFLTIYDTVSEIKQNLIDTKGTLVKVIGDIKGLRVGQEADDATQSATN